VSASDNVGVTRIDYLVDGQLIGVFSPPIYTLAWDTSAVTAGQHTLTARASDAAGNTTTSAPVTVTVTVAVNTPPIGSLDWPPPGTTVSGTVMLPGWALDQQTTANTLSLTLLVDGIAQGTAPTRVARPDVCAVYPATTYPGACQSGYQFTWSAGALSNGSHTVAVRVTDGGGLSTTLGPVTVTVAGNTPPFGSLDWPPPGTTVSGTVMLPGWALDRQTTANTLALALLVDGTVVSAPLSRVTRNDVCAVYPATTYPGACQSGYQFTWNTSGLPSGSHTVAVRVTDGGGLSTTLGPVTVTRP